MGLMRWIVMAAVVYLALRWVRKWMQALRDAGVYRGYGNGDRGHRATRPSAAWDASIPTTSRPSPYDVLGISPEASDEHIRLAYQRLIQQYHPDRLTDLAPELRALAEQRTKEITAAYTFLKAHAKCTPS